MQSVAVIVVVLVCFKTWSLCLENMHALAREPSRKVEICSPVAVWSFQLCFTVIKASTALTNLHYQRTTDSQHVRAAVALSLAGQC